MSTDRKLVLWLCLLLALPGPAMAGDRGSPDKKPPAKQLTGMSIIGNDEAPTSLSIVPWKRSEIGPERTLHMPLNEHAEPVDREEFIRQLDFYESSSQK